MHDNNGYLDVRSQAKVQIINYCDDNDVSGGGIVAAHHLLAVAGDEGCQLMMGLPGCTTRCGNMSVPYLFGIELGCYLEGFNVT